jgi:hypothetical protein
MIREWIWSGGGMILTEGTKSLGAKYVPVPLCLPQIPYGLLWAWTQVSIMKGRRLTAWVTARSVYIINLKAISGLFASRYWNLSERSIALPNIDTVYSYVTPGPHPPSFQARARKKLQRVFTRRIFCQVFFIFQTMIQILMCAGWILFWRWQLSRR